MRFDDSYVSRLKARDPHTERHFAAYFGELLLIKLKRSVRSPDLIFDVRQETLLRVLQTIRENGIQNPERLGAFVWAVSNNVLLEHFRAEGRYRQNAPYDEPADDRVTLDRDLVDSERKRQVEEVLSGLPKKDRALLRMVFLEERDRNEICREMGVTAEYLRVVLHRAKARFREKYLAARTNPPETDGLGDSQ
ncbi:MAG: RNA polymerase sigma factor [Acidobacteriota bacterium]